MHNADDPFFHPNALLQGFILNDTGLSALSFPGRIKRDPSPMSLMGKKRQTKLRRRVLMLRWDELSLLTVWFSVPLVFPN